LKELRRPLLTDEKVEDLIDYNWQVDRINKNAQSYDKKQGAVAAQYQTRGKHKGSKKRAPKVEVKLEDNNTINMLSGRRNLINQR
jgi:hypothetical protein